MTILALLVVLTNGLVSVPPSHWQGIDIQVPTEWSVEPRFTPILGGCVDRRTPSPDRTGTQRLVIHGTAIMGSITVSN